MSSDYNFEEEAKNLVLERINRQGGAEDEELLGFIDEIMLDSRYSYIEVGRKIRVRRELFNSIKRLDILQDIIDDDDVTEIMINGYRDIFIEKKGRILKYERSFESREKLLDIVQRIAAKSNKIINESVPIIDTRLRDGSRINIVMNPIAIDGPAVTIRKFYKDPLTMEKLLDYGAISKDAVDFLQRLVISKYNIFICGGTGSGKTTFLNALSHYIPKDERVITIEDSAELKLQGIANLVKLEARSANSEGKNAVTIRDMIRASLRMRPDRIVVGEVRGGEALDMLQAMSTGHDGSMSTGHANGPAEMMMRLETMVLMAVDMPVDAIRNQIVGALDIVVHVGRLRDGSRKVLNISEVDRVIATPQGNKITLNPLYEYVSEGVDENGHVRGELKRTDKELINCEKLHKAGFEY